MPRGRSSGKSASSDSGYGGGPMRRPYRESRSKRGGDSFGKHAPRHHDGRDEEKPCRTLFVRNLKFDTPEDELWSIFKPFGDIKEIFNRIDARGMAFVHYYDLRSAERAMQESRNYEINGRTMDIHYSLPKDDIRTVKCDATKNQGTLLLSLNQSQSSLVDHELYELFQRFGDVKVIRTPNFRTYSENTARWQRLLEFYDSRAAVRAASATHGQSYKNGKWDVQYFWDQGPRGGTGGRESSPSRRGTRFKQPDHRPYQPESRHKIERFSPPQSQPPPRDLVPHANYGTNAPIDPGHMDNTQKAQKLISMLSQLQSIQNAQPQSSPMYVQPQLLPQPPLPQLTQQSQGSTDQIQQLISLLTQGGNNGNPQPNQPPATQPQPIYAPYVQTDYQQQHQPAYQSYHPAMQPQYQRGQHEPQQQYQDSQKQYIQHTPTSYSLGHPPYNP